MKKYRLRREVLFRKEGNEGFVFNVSTRDLDPLNETGTFIVSQFERWKSVDEVADEACRCFAAPRKKDILSFVAMLVKKGILKESDE